MKTQNTTSRRMLLTTAASCIAIGAPAAHAQWTLLDNFESYATGPTTTVTGGLPNWSAEFIGTGNSNVVASDKGQSLQSLGGAAWRGAEIDISATAGIPIGNTQTVFFQMKAVGSGFFDVMTGLSADVANIDSTNAWQDFGVMPFVAGTAGGDLGYHMTDAGLAGDEIFPMATDVWYNVWLVVDNSAETYSVYYSTGTSDGTFGGTAAIYRNGFTNTALNALGYMAAGDGTSQLLVDNVYYDSSGANFTFPISDPDTDSDGLPDSWEITNFGDLSQSGTDNPDSDGFDNIAEYNAGSDPNNAASVPGDIDADGMDDLFEDQYFGNNNGTVEPGDLTQDGTGDYDRDFVTNADEETAGTFPDDASDWPDTDSDGLNDAWEVANFGNLAQTDSGDADSDGSDNLAEQTAGSDPNDAAWTATQAKLAHRWSFNNDLVDSVGGSNAVIVDPDANALVGGGSTLGPNSVTLEGGGKDESEYVSLGTNLLSGTQASRVSPVTLELWATPESIQTWSRVFAFGADGAPGLDASFFMSWSFGNDADNDRVEWNGRGLVDGSNAPYELTVPYHFVITITPAVYSDGALARGAEVTWHTSPVPSSQAGGHPLYFSGSFAFEGADLSDLVDSACFLGRSMYPDQTANATYDEVRIWQGALTSAERALFHQLGPDNIDRSDTDSDGLPDQWEIANFGDLSQLDTDDPDSDGDDNLTEFEGQSDPNNALSDQFDTDADGLDDTGFETLYFPNLFQTGADDPDGDLVSNEEEETGFSDPTDALSQPDNDADGLDDGWEYQNFGDLSQLDTDDPDSDGDDNLTEFTNGTDPNDPFSGSDSDSDGLPDFWELNFFGDLDEVAGGDPDSDGSVNLSELNAGTDPTDGGDVPDINGDGIPDGHTLVASDAFGQTSFNSGLNWDDGLAPAGGNNYLVFGQDLRSPDVASALTTFAGDVLVISTNGFMVLKGENSTVNAPWNLDGGRISNSTSGNTPVTVGGTILVTAASEINAENNNLIINAPISGTEPLTLTDVNGGDSSAVVLNVANPYSGDLTYAAAVGLTVNGSLAPGSGSVFNFTIGASGVNNTIDGTGSVTLNGALVLDLSGASANPGDSWTLVSTSTVAYDPSFTVTGFTPDAGAVGSRVWSDGTYQYDEATGILSVPLAGFSGWATDNGLDGSPGAEDGAEDNPEGDLYANVLEYQLGGDPLAFENDLVDVTDDGTNLVFTFERYDVSEGDSTLNFQWGTTLADWGDSGHTVAIGAASSGPDANGITVTVTEDGGSTTDYDLVVVTLPKSLAVGGKLYGRLQGTQP